MLNRTALGVSLVIVLALAGTALAGTNAGPRKTSSSINLVLIGQAGAATTAAPHWGETVTFDVSTTATTQPSVAARCFQNGAQVYAHYGFFYGDWSPSRNFVLQSYGWTGGAADCTATLYYMNPQKGTEVDLATLPFHVDA